MGYKNVRFQGGIEFSVFEIVMGWVLGSERLICYGGNYK